MSPNKTAPAPKSKDRSRCSYRRHERKRQKPNQALLYVEIKLLMLRFRGKSRDGERMRPHYVARSLNSQSRYSATYRRLL
jgi:hypothetical protein